MMLELVDQRRIVDLHELLIAVIVGERDEQVERVAGRQQRARRRAPAPMRGDRVVHQPAMSGPSSGGWNQRERTNSESFWRTSDILDRPQHAGRRRGPDHRPEEPLAPRAGPRFGRQQHGHVGVVEPQIAQRAHRQIVAQCAREHGAVDAAGRSAGDDVDDHPQLDVAADLAQQIEIDRLGVVFRDRSRSGAIEERGLRALGPVGDRVQRARGAHQLEDLLGDAMHVDGERNAAEADQRDAKFLFAQDQSPCRVIRRPSLIMSRERRQIGSASHSIVACRILDPHRRSIAVGRRGRAGISSAWARSRVSTVTSSLAPLAGTSRNSRRWSTSRMLAASSPEPGGDLAQHARPVRNGEAERDDAVLALELAHHDRGQNARIDIAAAQDQARPCGRGSAPASASMAASPAAPAPSAIVFCNVR